MRNFRAINIVENLRVAEMSKKNLPEFSYPPSEENFSSGYTIEMYGK